MSEPSLANELFTTVDRTCADAIRALSIDAVQKANSGHPGLPLGAAPMGYVLWQRHLKHDPRHPDWPDRDRFVLSPGHGSMLLYSLLHLSGYDVSLDDVKEFRQWGANTPGHPERGVTPGVETTTGPLGQGSANAVGLAIAERALAHRFNRPGHEVVDHFTYAIVSDGDLMEGLSAEAASLAGHLRLGKLICLYDSNDVSLDGPTSLSFSAEDVGARYEAYGWQVLRVEDGDTDLAAIDAAITQARTDLSRPSLIVVETTIGFGSPHKAGTSDAHGAPLGADEVAATKAALGWTGGDFEVPDDAREHFRGAVARGEAAREDWQARFDGWAAAHGDLAAQWRAAEAGELPDGWDAHLPTWEPGEKVATRAAAGKALNAIAAHVPWLIGGDADLSCSTKTAIADGGSFTGETGAGRNIHYGVREHAMGAVANGIACHGGLRTFTATFFVFADYMRPPMRLAAMNGLPVVHVFTHDSIGVGEDGPTHQPIEHLASLRAMPGLHVVRPGDATEAAEAWRYAMLRKDGPTALVLSRQKLPVLDRGDGRFAPASGLHKGGYVLHDSKGGEPHAILIATGSEVSLAVEAHTLLHAEGVRTRIVSLPCWEAFAGQDEAYRESVLPRAIAARVSVEAAATFGWERFVGGRGRAFGIDRFGASAPGDVNFEKLGFTAERVAQAVRDVLAG